MTCTVTVLLYGLPRRFWYKRRYHAVCDCCCRLYNCTLAICTLKLISKSNKYFCLIVPEILARCLKRTSTRTTDWWVSVTAVLCRLNTPIPLCKRDDFILCDSCREGYDLMQPCWVWLHCIWPCVCVYVCECLMDGKKGRGRKPEHSGSQKSPWHKPLEKSRKEGFKCKSAEFAA